MQIQVAVVQSLDTISTERFWLLTPGDDSAEYGKGYEGWAGLC